jgi:hypothetical protein
MDLVDLSIQPPPAGYPPEPPPHVPAASPSRPWWRRALCALGLHEGPLWFDRVGRYHRCTGCWACDRHWTERR